MEQLLPTIIANASMGMKNRVKEYLNNGTAPLFLLAVLIGLGAPANSQQTYTNDELRAAIRALSHAELKVKDAPRKNAWGDFAVAAGNHTNGMARLGPWWITNYPNAGRKKGRVLYWNENEKDYETPIVFDAEGRLPVRNGCSRTLPCSYLRKD